MSNVANLENCKELYELSGWPQIDDFSDWYQDWGNEDWGIGSYDANCPNNYPAYDLGYLLRKLQGLKKYPILELRQYNRWWCFYGNRTKRGSIVSPQKDCGIADTPEDAACRLAIELIKQGVIE